MIRLLLLTARTALHLRPRQLARRLLRIARRAVPGPRLRTPTEAPRLRVEVQRMAGATAARLGSEVYAPVLLRAERLRDGVLYAVGESMSVEEIDWSGRPRSHLFSYHLHYFDEAPGLAVLARRGDPRAGARLCGLWESWLDSCRDGMGDGWDPYPIASRIPNWIEALVLLEGTSATGVAGDLVPSTLRDRVLSSLWAQADRLHRTIEFDLGGNHLLRNLTALVCSAAVLDPAPTELAPILDHLTRELDRQILPDGMHEERTPAYHLHLLHDVLRTIAVLRAVGVPVPELEAHVERMRVTLRAFVRSDGGLHPFGDTTPNPQPSPAAIDRFAEDLLGASLPGGHRSGAWHLESAGFSGVRTDDLEIVMDCGPFGARHQPAHGHCDALSFVLSVRGTPVVVDPGVSGYADDPHRGWARGTSAHNTVQVDGREQTEIWGAFRAARRARPGPAGAASGKGEFRIFGTVTPFHDRKVVHERELLVRGSQVEVHDRVRGVRDRRIDAWLHFAAGTGVEPGGPRRWLVTCGSQVLEIEASGVDEARWETGKVFPDWGRVEEAPVLHASIRSCGADLAAFGFRIRQVS